LSGYAGAVKNVAMGMSSKPAKQVQHSSLKPHVMNNKCVNCGCCVKICPVQAISIRKEKAFIDQEKCIGCGECLCACKFDAVFINWGEDHDVFAKRLIDVAHYILSKFKNKFFITFGLDITKECDCISTKNEKIFSENIGILASKDPIAIDKAMVDLVNKNKDVFKETGLMDTYKTMAEYGCKKGLGSLDYNLIKI
jgi:uncharacterized Fe-S center protein